MKFSSIIKTISEDKKQLIPKLKEKFSPGSKCLEFFAGEKRLAGCFEAKCDKQNEQITIKIGDQEYTAKYKNGKTETEFFEAEAGPGKLKFSYPDFERFCFDVFNPIVSKPFRKEPRKKRSLLSRIFD